MKKFILLCFLSIFTTATAQYDWTEGSIQLKDGTILKGEVKIEMIEKGMPFVNGKEKVKYRMAKGEEKTNYGEDRIEKVLVTGENGQTMTFIYMPYSKSKQSIFQEIIRGKASLYGRSVKISSGGSLNNPAYPMNHHTIDSNEFFVMRPGEAFVSPLVRINDFKSFKKSVKNYFKDCQIILTNLESDEYDSNNVERLVTDYNNLCQ